MLPFYIGVDPGQTGALAVVGHDGHFIKVIDYPGCPDLLWAVLQRDLNPNCYLAKHGHVVIERVHAMPQQGVSSTFKFGVNFGIWLMALASTGMEVEQVSPMKWRKVLPQSVPLKPTKEDLRQFAIYRWPEAEAVLARKKDHNRAEALLMAEYCRISRRVNEESEDK